MRCISGSSTTFDSHAQSDNLQEATEIRANLEDRVIYKVLIGLLWLVVSLPNVGEYNIVANTAALEISLERAIFNYAIFWI